MDAQLEQELLVIAESEKEPVVEKVETEKAPESEQVKTEEQVSEPETSEQTEKPSEKTADKTFTQAELDEIVQKRITKLERKMARERKEAENQPQAEPVVQQSEKPKSENFDNYDDFLEALADYKAETKLVELDNKRKQAEIETTRKTEEKRQEERRHALVDDGEDKYDDFHEVVSASKLQIAEPAYLAILESDLSSDLVYFLAKNDDEATRISALTPYAQAKEIGKLEDKLSAKKPIIKSTAPPPINPVNGSKDHTKRLEDMSIAEYEAEARKRGARWI